ncbi:MAG TPA: flagellar hook-basal body complex protein FliE [Polyangiaceae bacterium]|jgi:flagellar hook-basal body complex protein FliE|nr:flagellar hook-basal body complex protein FliE [Polyangiaceae bacterium]
MGPIDAPGIPLAQPHLQLGVAGSTNRTAEGTAVHPFADMLETAIASANNRSQTAQIQAEDFAAGRNEDIHGTMLALSQADIELRFVGNIRNKIVDAFYELWRMQI